MLARLRFLQMFLCVLVTSLVLGCVTIGSQRLLVQQNVLNEDNYAKVKQIVTEEAASNGFGTLTSEIKPSQFNDWKGRLFFQLRTVNGTDQLFVEFSKAPEGVYIRIHGAGTRVNANSATKAISARLQNLGSSQPATESSKQPRASEAAPGRSVDKTPPAPEPSKQTKTPDTEPGRKDDRMPTAELQELLRDLGYNPGPVDSKMGKATINALKKFQQDNNLAITGQADSTTVDRLRKQKAEAKTQPPKAPPAVETPQKPLPLKVKSPTDL